MARCGKLVGTLRLASTLTENLLLEYTNGMRGTELGWGRLNAANLLQVMSLHTTYAELMRRNPEFARSRAARLAPAIVRSLEQAVTGRRVPGALGLPSTRLLVLSGHDTNISNLSGLLNVHWTVPSHQPDDVPPGAAILISLWKTPALTVRVQFVAQTLQQMHDAIPLSLAAQPSTVNLFVPACSAAADGYACSWPAFRRSLE